jgi:organic radical activating enzyme
MSYRINEVFYSLQGEGRHTGRAAIFVRFSGCNLRCPFCDTDFSHYTEMSLGELLAAIKPWRDCGFVVLTGGEPSLQAD